MKKNEDDSNSHTHSKQYSLSTKQQNNNNIMAERRRSNRPGAGEIDRFQPENFHGGDNGDDMELRQPRRRRDGDGGGEDGQPRARGRPRRRDPGRGQANRPANQPRTNSQQRATRDEVPHHTPEFLAMNPFLAEIFVATRTPDNILASMNSQRYDSVPNAEHSRFGINDFMLPLVKLYHASLKVNPDADERVDFGFPSPRRNRQYQIPEIDIVPPTHVRWVWVNNPDILRGLETTPNANYEDIPLSPDIIRIFGLNEPDPVHAIPGCGDTTRPGKWCLRIKDPLSIAAGVLRYDEINHASGSKSNPWTHFMAKCAYIAHTNEYSSQRRRRSRSSRRYVKFGPALNSTVLNEYDPANPMIKCRPSEDVYVWAYHPKFLPGCNAKEFLQLKPRVSMPPSVFGERVNA